MLLFKTAALAALATLSMTGAARAAADPAMPTIVLVHGAFADASSWNGVVAILSRDGFPVIAAANPLQGVQSDAIAVGSVVASIPGPVVLVGHSYGGAVISAGAADRPSVKALVYVAASSPLQARMALA